MRGGSATSRPPARRRALPPFVGRDLYRHIESFEGTCYKAAARQPCDITKGFTREHRADCFLRNNRPKKPWPRVLHHNAGPMLCGIEMQAQHAAGLNLDTPERARPLRAKQMESLREEYLEGYYAQGPKVDPTGPSLHIWRDQAPQYGVAVRTLP